MKYYSITQSSKYKTLIDEDLDLKLYHASSEYAFGENASTLTSKTFNLAYNTDDKKKEDRSDIFTYFRPTLIVTSKALEVISSIVPDSFIKIKINSPNTDHHGIVITSAIHDALDKEQAEFDEYPQGLVVYKYALKESKIPNLQIFRLKESPLSIFVSENFVHLAKKQKLVGVDFKEIPTN
ncbi:MULTISPECIES: imm11 family protein [Pseudomonas]|uniref:imm11 family protein n=1 Tax=Pseudomonas TaxID=286 RepID=UPI0023D864D7|nr:DUF1629 domain-containing protein [Pseudomonas sp. 273]